MQSVRVMVTRRREYRGGDCFEVFGDGGSGTIDYSRGLTGRRVALWAEAAERRGHLRDGHLTLRHLDSVERDGHLSGIHMNDDHLIPAGVIQVEVGRYVFGRFGHVVKMYDAVGNACADEGVILSTVINSSPDSPARLRPVSFDNERGQFTFSFEPSPKLVG